MITSPGRGGSETGSSSTWVLSNHDVVRHASRYALPAGTDLDAWLMTRRQPAARRRGGGLRRARAATLLMLALPGSAYLYQGEELGLPEVADLPADALQDPIWVRTRTRRRAATAAACRCRGSTTATLRLRRRHAWLPQPADFAGPPSRPRQDDPGSTLELYRGALRLRRQLQTAEELEWVETGDPRCCISSARAAGTA